MPSLRTFVALELDAATIAQLSGVQVDLRASLHSMFGRDSGALRPTRAHQMHMTLAFIGDTPSTSVAEIAAILGEVSARHAPIAMSADRVCYLPKSACATAIGVSFIDEFERGAALARDVMRGLAPAGFAFEHRRFLAHITLLRSRKGLRIPLDMPQVLRDELEKIVLKLQRVTYFASFLDPTGARYERLWSTSLGTDQS